VEEGTAMNKPELIDMNEMAEMLSIHKKTLYRFIKAKKDPTFPEPIVFGPKTLRWVKQEVEQWLSASKQKDTE
jgi:predicted DNA-binding transcriptional regulator AlpA